MRAFMGHTMYYTLPSTERFQVLTSHYWTRERKEMKGSERNLGAVFITVSGSTIVNWTALKLSKKKKIGQP